MVLQPSRQNWKLGRLRILIGPFGWTGPPEELFMSHSGVPLAMAERPTWRYATGQAWSFLSLGQIFHLDIAPHFQPAVDDMEG